MSLELRDLGHNQHVDICTTVRGSAAPIVSVEIKVGDQSESQDCTISFNCDSRGRMCEQDTNRMSFLLMAMVGPHMSAVELEAVCGMITARHGVAVVGAKNEQA